MSILVFIPMYNCEKQISRVLEKLAAYQDYFTEVLVVDNGSSDRSLEVASETKTKLNNPVKIVQNQENYSLGGSHKVAFNYARENNFDYVITLHGDDQGNFEDLLPLIKNEEYKKYDCLLGARFHPKSELRGYAYYRILGNHVLNLFCSVAIGRKVLDMGAGLNMYRVGIFEKSNYLNFPNDLTYNIFLMFEHFHQRLKVKYFPILWVEEDQVSNARMLRQALKIMKLSLIYFFNRKVIEKEDPSGKIEYKYKVI